MNTYTTIFHCQCPVDKTWIYYDFELKSSEMVPVEVITEVINALCGSSVTQEQATRYLKKELRKKLDRLQKFTLNVVGRHPHGVVIETTT